MMKGRQLSSKNPLMRRARATVNLSVLLLLILTLFLLDAGRAFRNPFVVHRLSGRGNDGSKVQPQVFGPMLLLPYRASDSRHEQLQLQAHLRSHLPRGRRKSSSQMTLTNVLIALNVIGFLVTSRSPALKLKFMKIDRLISRRGQYYRLFTSMFLHGDLLHLFCNCYALNNIGPMVNSIFGAKRYAAIYLGAGLLANIGTFMAGTSPYALGASGAVFGLLGALLAFFQLNKRAIGPTADMMISNINQNLMINLMYGISSRNVDNWAHFGGLVAGGLLTFAVGSRGRFANTRRSSGSRSSSRRSIEPGRPVYYSSDVKHRSSKDSGLRGIFRRVRGGTDRNGRDQEDYDFSEDDDY